MKSTVRKKTADVSSKFERHAKKREPEHYELRLYVTGMTARSSHSIAAIKAICEERLPEHYTLQVIDIYQQPQLARGEQIIAAPTLIKKLPLPLRRLVGDLSNLERVLVGLDLRADKTERAERA